MKDNMPEKAKEQLPSAFVTYGWCRTAYTVVRSLGAHGVEVHVGDNSKLAMSRFSKYTKSYTHLPDFFAEPSAYMDALAAAMKQCGATVLFPCHEDVETVIRYRDRLPENIQVAVPEYEDWNTAEDKLDYVRHVAAAGCPVPDTYEVGSKEELLSLQKRLDFPVVVKTRIGNSAKGVAIVRHSEELESAFMKLVEEYKLPPERWPTIQAFVPGKKLGVLGVYNRGKHLSSIVFDIVRSKGADNFGTSTFRVTIDDPAIKGDAIKAMESLNWHGVVDMDWLRDEDGTARLIDINGRLGGATALTYISGMDMPWLWYQAAIGVESIDVPPPAINAKARWILGDMLGAADSLRKRRFKEFFEALTPQKGCRHDDLVLSDPLPAVFQALDYLSKFVKAGGNTNPVSEGMIR
ncbi:MAG: ATP-grasp domain-containing protein [Opitutaceae bacterium]